MKGTALRDNLGFPYDSSSSLCFFLTLNPPAAQDAHDTMMHVNTHVASIDGEVFPIARARRIAKGCKCSG
eukprot:313067-Pelagomonas_calceolata.AAC.1